MNEEAIRVKIARMIADAYTTGNFEPLFPLMTENYEHHSFWVMNPMIGKDTVIPYYRGKGLALKNSTPKPRTELVRIIEPEFKPLPGEVYLNGEKMKPGTRLAIWSDIGNICVLMHQILDDGTESSVLAIPTINEEGQLTRLLITDPILFSFVKYTENV